MVEETTQNEKKKVDSAKAAEMRNRALENLGGTQKRQRKDEVENETAARAKRRRSGDDTVMTHDLREKNDLMQKWKMEEMQLQKQRLEAESKKEEQSKKQNQDLMQVMLQQSKQQQEQMQNFQMFTLMQQQQSQIIVKLLEKQN